MVYLLLQFAFTLLLNKMIRIELNQLQYPFFPINVVAMKAYVVDCVFLLYYSKKVAATCISLLRKIY